MIKLINNSTNRKTGAIATTYRAGGRDVFSTCPNTCALKPVDKHGSNKIDQVYLKALKSAVVRGGVSWTYSHFKGLPVNKENETVINQSTDTIKEALESFNGGKETVYTAPASMTDKVDNIDGVKLVRCPAEYNDKINCRNCGSGKPLCARLNRSYIIKFVAHGNQKKKIGVKDFKGGCYANSGHTRFAWQDTQKRNASSYSDAERLTGWVKTLPHGTFIRHHIAGDIGNE